MDQATKYDINKYFVQGFLQLKMLSTYIHERKIRGENVFHLFLISFSSIVDIYLRDKIKLQCDCVSGFLSLFPAESVKFLPILTFLLLMVMLVIFTFSAHVQRKRKEVTAIFITKPPKFIKFGDKTVIVYIKIVLFSDQQK